MCMYVRVFRMCMCMYCIGVNDVVRLTKQEHNLVLLLSLAVGTIKNSLTGQLRRVIVSVVCVYV